MTVTKQSFASILRQVGAVAISAAYAGLLAAGDGGQLPTAVKAIIVGIGPAILLLEHYLGDTSTGTVTTDTPAGVAPVAPVAIAPQPVPSVGNGSPLP